MKRLTEAASPVALRSVPLITLSLSIALAAMPAELGAQRRAGGGQGPLLRRFDTTQTVVRLSAVPPLSSVLATLAMATRPPERGQFEATRAWRERYRQQVQAFVRVPFAGRLPAGSIEVSYDADHQVLLFHPTDWQLEIDSSGVEQSYFLRSGNVPSDRSTTLRMIRSGDYISLRSTLMFPFFPADTSIINAFRLARYREFDRARIGQEPTAADSSILYTTTWSLSLPASDARGMEPFWTFVLVFHIPEVTDSSEVSPYPLVVADSAEVWVIDSRSGRLIARVESHRFRLSRRRRE